MRKKAAATGISPPYSQPKGKQKSKATTTRQRLNLVQGIAVGKKVPQPARDSAYPKSTSKTPIYQIVDTPEFQERLKVVMAQARLDTQEIVGTSVGHMRIELADLYPNDPILQEAQKKGISRNVKKIKSGAILKGFDGEGQPIYRPITEVECHSAQKAVKSLAKFFGMTSKK